MLILYTCLLLLSTTSTLAVECQSPCLCNRTSSWNSVSYIQSVPKSQVLDCDKKNLNEIPHPIDNSIVIMIMNGNHIKKLEIREFPQNLEVINLNDNEINEVGIFEANKVRFIHLMKNKLTRIPITSTSVEYMDLDNNEISADPDNNLLYYPKLKRIDLKYNKLEVIPHIPETIVEFVISENRIKFISDFILSKATNLKKLFLSNNNIYKIYLPEAYYLSRLEVVNLENNPLEIDPVVKTWCEKENKNDDLCKKAKST